MTRCTVRLNCMVCIERLLHLFGFGTFSLLLCVVLYGNQSAFVFAAVFESAALVLH